MEMILLQIHYNDTESCWQFAPGTGDGIPMADYAQCNFSNTINMLCPGKQKLIAGILGKGGRYDGWRLNGIFAGFLPEGRTFYNVLLIREKKLRGEQPPRYQEA